MVVSDKILKKSSTFIHRIIMKAAMGLGEKRLLMHTSHMKIPEDDESENNDDDTDSGVHLTISDDIITTNRDRIVINRNKWRQTSTADSSLSVGSSIQSTTTAPSSMAYNQSISMSCSSSVDSAPTSSSMNIDQLPPSIWHHICQYLSIIDYCNLQSVSIAIRKVIDRMLTAKSCNLVLERELGRLTIDATLALSASQSSLLTTISSSSSSSAVRLFSTPHDYICAYNRAIDELDSNTSIDQLRSYYADLDLLLRKCGNTMEKMSFVDEKSYKTHYVQLGRSVFRFLSTNIYEQLCTLDLTRTRFELCDLELTQMAFPELRHLIVDHCCIFLNRRDILMTNCDDRQLCLTMIDYRRKRRSMRTGSKLFLSTIVNTFPELQTVNASSAEYQSSGCITFGYGRENIDAIYEFRQRRSIRCRRFSTIARCVLLRFNQHSRQLDA